MCIAILKKATLPLPPEAVLKHCYNRNPDGAGFMIGLGTEVLIRKGFKTWDSFWTGLQQAAGEFGPLEQLPMALHFRIGTHGSKNAPEHTHPFPLCDDYGVMQQLEVRAPWGVVHNGIMKVIFSSSRYSTYSHWDAESATWINPANHELEPSDTMEFIKFVLAAVATVPNWAENVKLKELVTKLLDGTNRVAVMTPTGEFLTFGTWIEADGILYSNEGYKLPELKPTTEPKPSTVGQRELSFPNKKLAPNSTAAWSQYRYDLDRDIWTRKERAQTYQFLRWFDTQARIRVAAMRKRWGAVEQTLLGCQGSGNGYSRLCTIGFRAFYTPAVLYFNSPALLPIHLYDPKQAIYVNDAQTVAYEYSIEDDTLVTLGTLKYIDFEPALVAYAGNWFASRPRPVPSKKEADTLCQD